MTIPGYTYGSANVATSPVTLAELEELKQSAGFTADDENWLRRAGTALAPHTTEIVGKWRAILASHPHLARYSLKPDGTKDERYSHDSGLRLAQWILDTCCRPYDQNWLNYQQEIALRHTSIKKNKTDHADSAPFINLRHVIAFTAVVIDPNIMKPCLAWAGDDPEAVEKMHRAWCKSVLLQIALWTKPYTSSAPNEW